MNKNQIRETKILIGVARLNAFRSKGFVQKYLYRQADELEKKLKKPLTK